MFLLRCLSSPVLLRSHFSLTSSNSTRTKNLKSISNLTFGSNSMTAVPSLALTFSDRGDSSGSVFPRPSVFKFRFPCRLLPREVSFPNKLRCTFAQIIFFFFQPCVQRERERMRPLPLFPSLSRTNVDKKRERTNLREKYVAKNRVKCELEPCCKEMKGLDQFHNFH